MVLPSISSMSFTRSGPITSLMIVTVLVIFQAVSSTNRTREVIKIAWLAPKESFRGFSAPTSVNALKMTLLLAARDFIKNHSIHVQWYDSQCDAKAALTAAVDARRDFDPDLFLGPACSEGMNVVAMLASHWNLPIFGWVSNNHELEDRKRYSTLVRTLGPLNKFSYTMKYVNSLFEWYRFAMIFDTESEYQSVHNAIASFLRNPESRNTITSSHGVDIDMSDEEIQEIFLQIMKYARVIIFSVPWLSMRKYMLVAHRLGMTSGEFAFICINSDVYTQKVLKDDIISDHVWRRNDTHDEEARTAFEAVIYVMLAQGEKYEAFENLLRVAENYTNPNWTLPASNKSHSDPYAPFLYDAITIWATLVNKSLENGYNPRNGSQIFRMAQIITGDGVTGSLELDTNADRQVNNWFLDMGPDGRFQVCVSIFNTLRGGKMNLPKKIRWPDGTEGNENAPKAFPPCGFEDTLCLKAIHPYDDPIIFASIGASLGGALLIILAISMYCYFRHQRDKQKWAGMMWQVKMADVDFLSAMLSNSVRYSFRKLGRRKNSGASKKMIGKGHQKNVNYTNSDDRRSRRKQDWNSGNTFGSVCYYKGSIVSVKRVTKLSLNKELISQFNHLLDLKCQNLTAFLGCIMDNERNYMLLWEYCAKGSLQDIIFNTNIKLDKLFKFALCQDVTKGLEFLHKTYIGYHGNLKSSNCVVDSRWTCKLTDFGVPELREMTRVKLLEEDSSALYERDLWTAPEVLRGQAIQDHERRLADMYSLGIIMKEIFTRTGPYSEFTGVIAKEIIDKVMHPNHGVFRPSIPNDLPLDTELVSLIYECLSEEPTHRPLPNRVSKTLNRINPNKHNTVIDNMLAMLEKYANHLEELVAERTSELDAEKQKTETLLYRMLPQTVAEDLKMGKPVKAELFDQVTIYFSDIVGFTKICAQSTPIEVVNLLNSLYTTFDDIITRYDVYKVETIGDAYMLASGLPKRNGDNHITQIADVSLDIMGSIDTFRIPHLPDRKLHIRIGIHTGSVVAGVVGLAMPRYCLFGDAVNTASRMESTGLPMRIHMSQNAHDKLMNNAGYHVEPRGEITVKGKGSMFTYFLTGKDGFQKTLPTNTDYVEVGTPRKDQLQGAQNGISINVQDFGDRHAKLSDTSGQRVRRNTSVSSDTCPVLSGKRNMSTSSFRSRQVEENEGLDTVDVKSLRKTFESSVSVVSGSKDLADAILPVMETAGHRTLNRLDSSEQKKISAVEDAVSPGHCPESLETVCRHLNALNNFLDAEMKRDNSYLERERQHLQQHQVQRKLEELESTKVRVNHLEKLLSNPKAENKLLGSLGRQDGTQTGNMEMTASILSPITQAILSLKRGDCDAQSRHAHTRVLAHCLYKEPKLENTEHRNSPQSSRPASPKPDVAFIKEQISTRLHQKGKELVTPM